jgi:FkbM family methyltransferase
MISYAQNFEDVMLARVFGDKRDGFYIDVGAWHPLLDSVTKHFYDLGWRGINIEPSPEYFALLKRDRRRDINCCLALGERAERRRYYRSLGAGLSTLSETCLDAFEQTFVEDTCDVVTLRQICERYVRAEIDFLKIDAEGWELPVIRGGDWVSFRPKVVVVEATAPGRGAAGRWQDWEGILLDNGFFLCYFDGLNRFYLRQEDASLHSCFRFPPNVYDNIVTYESVRMERERDEAIARERRLKSLCARLRREKKALERRLLRRRPARLGET